MYKYFAIAYLLLVLNQGIVAQNMDFKNTLTLHYGVSVFNAFNGSFSAFSGDTLQHQGGGFSRVPTLGVAWDAAVAKWFSIGVAASYNNAKLTMNQASFLNQPLGDVDIKVSRTTFAARFLLHYANKNRFDCYSGFRLGIGIWKPQVSTEITPIQAESIINAAFEGSGTTVTFGDDLINRIPNKVSFVAPQMQFILFGIRGFLTENIGVNGELAFGSPYFLSLGANYRF